MDAGGLRAGVRMERAQGEVLAPGHSGGSGGTGSRHRGLGATLRTAEPGVRGLPRTPGLVCVVTHRTD